MPCSEATPTAVIYRLSTAISSTSPWRPELGAEKQAGEDRRHDSTHTSQNPLIRSLGSEDAFLP